MHLRPYRSPHRMEKGMLTPEQIADGWIEHDGKWCPVEIYAKVSVRFGNGAVDGPAAARLWEWKWRNDPMDDIIAYKPELTP